MEAARSFGLAGATVTRGIMGFRAHSKVHTTNVLLLAEDLPEVVQLIDVPERIDAFLPTVRKMISEGLVMSVPVHIEVYRAREQGE